MSNWSSNEKPAAETGSGTPVSDGRGGTGHHIGGGQVVVNTPPPPPPSPSK